MNVLLFYSTLVSLFVTVSGFVTATDEGNLGLQAVFLPVTLTLILACIRTLRGKAHANPSRLATYYSFIVVALFTVASFASARSVTELIVAYFFSPTFVYFILQILPKRSHAITLPKEVEVAPAVEKVVKLERVKEDPAKVDRDRRAFIKLIGTAGTTIFLFSVFGIKKAEAAFFGSVPGPGTVSVKDIAGNKIDPAEKHPTDGYKITQLDDSTPAYYGFVNKSGAWFIQKEDSSGNYRYTKGSSDFTNATTGWPNHTNLSYDYFDNVF